MNRKWLIGGYPLLLLGTVVEFGSLWAANPCEWVLRGEQMRLEEGQRCSFTGGPPESCSYLVWQKGSEQRKSSVYFRKGISGEDYCKVASSYDWGGGKRVRARQILANPEGSLRAYITCNGTPGLLLRDLPSGQTQICRFPGGG